MSRDRDLQASFETASDADVPAMERALAAFLRAAGLAEAAQGEAPAKTAAAWAGSLIDGYGRDPAELLRPTWPDRAGQLVSITGIPFVSVCEHHLLPFFGHVHVVYLPGGRLTGLSRVEEMVHALAHRLQLQERLGEQIVSTLQETLEARGAGCAIEAEHLCVFARGKRQRGTVTRTLAWAGEFGDDAAWQDRCLRWLTPAFAGGAVESAGPRETVHSSEGDRA